VVSPAVDYNVLKDFTCADGYVPAAIAGDLTAHSFVAAANTASGSWGCVACGTNVKTCAGTFATTTDVTTGTTTFVSCLTGYF